MSRRDEVLVTTGWVADHADDPALRLVEVDEDTAAYAGGHIRNAIAWHWRDDLHEAPRREFIGQEALAAEPGPLGPGRPELRAFRDDVLAHLGGNGRSAAQEDGSFKSDDDLVVLYGGVGVMPHRRALLPHLVRAARAARLRAGAQLRRLLDRVRQPGGRARRALVVQGKSSEKGTTRAPPTSSSRTPSATPTGSTRGPPPAPRAQGGRGGVHGRAPRPAEGPRARRGG